MIELLDKLNNSEKKELSDREKIQKISAIIHHAETKLRNKFPILNKQNLLGTLILFVSCVGFSLNTYLYIQGIMPAWMCFILNAFCTSFLHELEHDLIHQLYSKFIKLILKN